MIDGKRRQHFSKNAPMLAAIGAGCIVVLLLLSCVLSSKLYYRQTRHIVLPSQAIETPQTNTEYNNRLLLQQVEISTENVQSVIASLSRPSAYSLKISNIVYYNNTESTLIAVQYVKNGVYRTEKRGEDDRISEIVLHNKDFYYAWNNGESRYYKGVFGDFSGDSVAMLPTYERLAALAEDSIVDAGLVIINEEPCIFLESKEDRNMVTYFISSINGLLVQAEYKNEGEIIRQVKVSDISTVEPADSLFVLPDGTNISNF